MLAALWLVTHVGKFYDVDVCYEALGIYLSNPLPLRSKCWQRSGS